MAVFFINFWLHTQRHPDPEMESSEKLIYEYT